MVAMVNKNAANIKKLLQDESINSDEVSTKKKKFERVEVYWGEV